MTFEVKDSWSYKLLAFKPRFSFVYAVGVIEYINKQLQMSRKYATRQNKMF